MMIKFFGALAEQVGCREFDLVLPTNPTDLTTVINLLGQTLGAHIEPLLQHPDTSVALNHSLLQALEQPLRDSDELAFFPPVTGG